MEASFIRVPARAKTWRSPPVLPMIQMTSRFIQDAAASDTMPPVFRSRRE